MGTLGTGTTIAFATSSFAAELLSLSGPGASREAINVSHMGTTAAHEFTPADLVDWGEVTMEIAFDPATTPPITAVAESITIDWGGTGNTWVFSGFITGLEPSAAIDERMTASITIKVTGAVA